MHRVARVTEEAVVLAFLRAERYSGAMSRHVEEQLGGAWHLLENPNLDNAAENARRAEALERCRGYPNVKWIFTGFPTDVEWWRSTFSVDEVGDMMYGRNQWQPVTLPHGRRLRDAAPHVQLHTEVFPDVLAIEQKVREGVEMEPIIVAAPSRDADHVLLEGWKRATAYVRILDSGAKIDALAGYSPSMSDWGFYWAPPVSKPPIQLVVVTLAELRTSVEQQKALMVTVATTHELCVQFG